jgi:hypothetical protein
MSTVAGVFRSRADAARAAARLKETRLHEDKIVLLMHDEAENHTKLKQVPSSDTEQPGMGAAVGGVIGGAVGVAGGLAGAAISAAIPGVGPVVAVGLLGAAVLGLAGIGVGAAAGNAIEDANVKGLPIDEWFVYEDALRKGRSVLLTFPDKEATDSVRSVMEAEAAESIDAAREQWWIGLRSAERERYAKTGASFDRDEKFYRIGFQKALRAGQDGAMVEMEETLAQLKSQNLDLDAEEAFRSGYERGRQYYEDSRHAPRSPTA